MQYAFLIYTEENDGIEPGSPAYQEIVAAYEKFEAEVTALGAMRGGAELQPTTTAKTVRVRQRKQLVTDGPFAETREQLGGFFLLECKDMDEAVSLAARIPAAFRGSVEVRPMASG